MDDEQSIALKARSFRRDNIAWLVLFFLITVWAAWYFWWKDDVVFTPLPPSTEIKSPRIAILSYERITTKEDGVRVSAGQLRSQLEALQADGFNPITVAQLRDFFLRKNPLPEKPMLLLFEHGYTETFENVDPILRDLGWHAAMGVQTRRMDDRDTAFVYWHQLQEMVDSGVWSVIAQGHQSDLPLAVSATKQENGNFLTHRAWLKSAQRLESDEEFSRRIVEDLRLSKNQLELNLESQNVFAFSYPMPVDFSSGSKHDRLLMERSVAGLFDIALTDDLLGINDRSVPRQRVKRMRVSVDLSAKDLVARVNNTLRAAADPSSLYWISSTGTVITEEDGLVLQGKPLAEAWLAGSQWQSHWLVEATIDAAVGQFWLVSDSDVSGTQWRVGGDGKRLNVQLLDGGRVEQTLATFPIKLSGAHHLKVVKRGAGLWLEWDGTVVSETPIFLPKRWRRGMVGWKSWDQSETSVLRVSEFKFEKYPYLVREVSAKPSTNEIQKLIEDASRIAAISYPAALSYDDSPEFQETRQLLNILSHRYGWELLTQYNEVDFFADARAKELDSLMAERASLQY